MKIVNISYDGASGVPVIREPASALKNNTGTWRVFRPTICPEGAIHVDDDDIWIDYDHCKGCGICVNGCRFITAQREV
jgi:Pyruvate/2-oxoacid:ferredoxin oxidoreductase delta subunit